MVVRLAGDELGLAAPKAEQDQSIAALDGIIRLKATAQLQEFRVPGAKGCSVIQDIHQALKPVGRNIKRFCVEHAPVQVLDAIHELTFLIEQPCFESRMWQSFKQTGPGQGTPPGWLPNSAARRGVRKLGGEGLLIGP